MAESSEQERDQGTGSMADRASIVRAWLPPVLVLVILLTVAFSPALRRAFLAGPMNAALLGIVCAGAAALGAVAQVRLWRGTNRLAQQLHAALENSSALLDVGAPQLDSLATSLNAVLTEARSARGGTREALASNRVLARELVRILQLLEAMQDGLLFVGTTGEVLYANRAAGLFLSMPPQEAKGKSVRECVKSEGLRGRLLAAAGHGVRITEIPPEETDGAGYFSAAQCHAFADGGESLGQLVVFRDITRARNTEELQSDFMDSMAHELRTPLTSISAYVEMLIDGDTDEDMQREFYNIIYQESFRLSNLIDNLLNMSMIESGSAKLDITPTRAKKLLEDCIAVVQGQCEAKSVELKNELLDRLPTLDVDKRLLEMAVMNILGNAAKYTPEGGSVTLSTESDDTGFQILVRDTGVGIPEESMARIFEKFYRCDPSAGMEEVTGSGVGLATAQQIVQRHGGEIRVESRLGEGSLFTIFLPRSLINTAIGD